MPFGDEAAKEVEASVQQMEWGVFPSETEEEYLGVDVVDSKVTWLQYMGYQASKGGLRMFDIEEMGPNMQMDQLYEDDKAFAVFQRTSGLVRASINPGDEGVRSRTFGQDLVLQDEQAELDTHIAFVDGKRLCIIFLVENAGGELELFPNPTGYDYNEVTIPLTKSKVVVFRCDALGLNYSYRPKGRRQDKDKTTINSSLNHFRTIDSFYDAEMIRIPLALLTGHVQ
eukprot:g30220.t1